MNITTQYFKSTYPYNIIASQAGYNIKNFKPFKDLVMHPSRVFPITTSYMGKRVTISYHDRSIAIAHKVAETILNFCAWFPGIGNIVGFTRFSLFTARKAFDSLYSEKPIHIKHFLPSTLRATVEIAGFGWIYIPADLFMTALEAKEMVERHFNCRSA